MVIHKISITDFNILINSDIVPAKYKLLMKIQATDGLRAGEVLNLKKDCLEFDNNLYRLIKQKNGILRGSRYMSESIKKELISYIHDHEKDIDENYGYLFYCPWKKKKGKINITTYCENFREWTTKLGIRRIYKIDKANRKLSQNSSHALRTMGINKYRKELLQKHGNISDSMVMLFSGHTNKLSLQAYEMNDDDDLIIIARKN